MRLRRKHTIAPCLLASVACAIAFALAQPTGVQAAWTPLSPPLELVWRAEEDLPEVDRQEAKRRLLDHLVWIENHLPDRWGQFNLLERGRWLFETMHERILTGSYDENQHSLSVALRKGDYNCVSATLLFQLLAERAGLPTTAMQTRGHVWCRLMGPAVDIETTCPDWFSLDPQVQAESPAVQAGEAARYLSWSGLVAKIPYNRATTAAASGDYAQAIRLLDEALALDPHDMAARTNRVVVLNNWAIECLNQQSCDQALAMLEEMTRIAGSDQKLAENRQRLVGDLIDACCRAGRYQDALRIQQWDQEATGNEPQTGGDSRYTARSIYQRWIEAAWKRGDALEARNALRLALAALGEDPLVAAQFRRQFRDLLPG